MIMIRNIVKKTAIFLNFARIWNDKKDPIIGGMIITPLNILHCCWTFPSNFIFIYKKDAYEVMRNE